MKIANLIKGALDAHNLTEEEKERIKREPLIDIENYVRLKKKMPNHNFNDIAWARVNELRMKHYHHYPLYKDIEHFLYDEKKYALACKNLLISLYLSLIDVQEQRKMGKLDKSHMQSLLHDLNIYYKDYYNENMIDEIFDEYKLYCYFGPMLFKAMCNDCSKSQTKCSKYIKEFEYHIKANK